MPQAQKVILIEENGELDVLQYKDYPIPEINDTEVLVNNKYAGINYIESYFRKGIYPSEKPYVLGREASGVVVKAGSKVTNFKVGDKVAYIQPGSFSQYQKVDAVKGKIFKIPQNSSEEDFKVLGSILIQGLTALTFADLAYEVKKGDYILIYAAAGGVGQILVQLVHQRGARAIAVASSDEKLQIAKDLGAEYLINSKKENIEAKVKEFTNGKGVTAAFDSIGKDTFETTLKTLAVNGRFVSYGNASGKVPPFEINKLPVNVAISRPTVMWYIADPDNFKHYADLLVDSYVSGKLKFNFGQTFDLKDYKEAARLLESRATMGKLTLKIPEAN